jgi:hypothetical protein
MATHYAHTKVQMVHHLQPISNLMDHPSVLAIIIRENPCELCNGQSHPGAYTLENNWWI